MFVLNHYILQGRRSQHVPPSSVHPTKRPRISSSQQSHPASMLPTGHNLNVSATSGMEALINSVTVKSVAGANFLNSSIYSAATEAAFYSLINANNHHNTFVASTSNNHLSFQLPLPGHHQRSSGSTGNNVLNVSHGFQHQNSMPSVSAFSAPHMSLSMPLLNSFGVSRSSFSHGLGLTHQGVSGGQSMTSVAGYGSQHNLNHLTGSNLSSKPSQPTVGQNTTHLISGNLHHSHLPTQHNFHQSHSLTQSNTHHMMGHANLSHGSGILRQQTKEPAYHPQVCYLYCLLICV